MKVNVSKEIDVLQSCFRKQVLLSEDLRLYCALAVGRGMWKVMREAEEDGTSKYKFGGQRDFSKKPP